MTTHPIGRSGASPARHVASHNESVTPDIRSRGLARRRPGLDGRVRGGGLGQPGFLAGTDRGEAPAGHAERAEPAPRAEQPERRQADVPAHSVEHHVHLARRRLDQAGHDPQAGPGPEVPDTVPPTP